LIVAAGLGDALGEDIFTLFAPNNDAFAAVPAEFVDAVTTNIEFLRNALLYHAVPEVEIRAENLVCDAEVMMANTDATTTTCIGDAIYQVGNGNSPDALPKIVAQDGDACNGVIHVIDQVMLQGGDVPTVAPKTDAPTDSPKTEAPTDSPKTDAPVVLETDAPVEPPKTVAPAVPVAPPTPLPVDPNPTPEPSDVTCKSIVEVACDVPEFTTLCGLVGDAGLVDVLGGEEKFTVFMPTNDAFASLPQEIVDAVTSDSDLLKSVLLSHAVAGEVLFIKDLVCSGKVVMANGDETTTTCAGEKFYQSGAGNNPSSFPEIIAPDGVACNGVIHSIDQVILPGSDAPEDPAPLLRGLRAVQSS